MSSGIELGCSLEKMKSMADASVDSVVTDPPYGLEFMGKGWDKGVPGVEFFAEMLRVLKPGGHLLSFGGSRTYHRMACAVEDAGFEIRDQIMWIYGTGFPKSKNLDGDWKGWGTALKPAHEPIVMARKPLIGTVAKNVAAFGCGAINIDGCRVELNGDYKCAANGRPSRTGLGDNYDPAKANLGTDVGRWPADLIHDGSEEVTELFPGSSGSGRARVLNRGDRIGEGWGMADQPGELRDAGSGSAARFFYCAKASKSEREKGCDDLDDKPSQKMGDGLRSMVGHPSGGSGTTSTEDRKSKNNHPTVKPLALMRYLCRLVTPPGGLILDPFAGSGTTGVAAKAEGFQFIGFEKDPAYFEIATRRLA